MPTLTLLSVAYLDVSIYYFFGAIMITAMVPSTMLFWPPSILNLALCVEVLDQRRYHER